MQSNHKILWFGGFLMKQKICVFNWVGLLMVFSIAICSSLLVSIDAASAAGEELSWLEMFRAAVCGLIAVGGFFTKQRVEESEEN